MNVALVRRGGLVSHCGEFVKVRLNAAIAKNFAKSEFKFFVVDNGRGALL